ncbi:hypothetical protein GOV10_05410 [Candidatus Woesearchaeota archaeon]|nr:hypothetical protein [Candidatus Woesearchaeota archaeon]
MKGFGILLITGLLLLAACTTNATPTGNIVTTTGDTQTSASDAQIVHVTVVGGEYQFSTDTVEAGKPVQLVFAADELPGCSKNVMVPEYGQRKLITPDDNVIEFTPTKTGPIDVACTMNMYKGKLNVE